MRNQIIGIAAKDCKAGDALTLDLKSQFAPVIIDHSVDNYETFLENVRMEIASAFKIPRNMLFGNGPEHYNCRCFSEPIGGHFTLTGGIMKSNGKKEEIHIHMKHDGEWEVKEKPLEKLSKKELIKKINTMKLIQEDNLKVKMAFRDANNSLSAKNDQLIRDNEGLKKALSAQIESNKTLLELI